MQLPGVLRRIVEASYRPLLAVLAGHPQARCTININGVLSEMLYEFGYSDVLDDLRELAGRGQIELTGSAKHHAILPLLDDAEQRRQIDRNALANGYFFGDAFGPRGFFPPEMCYARSILDPAIDAGHEWVVASGIACAGLPARDRVSRASAESGREVGMLFRDDDLSNAISFRGTNAEAFVEELRSRAANGEGFVVTAMDAETFGHHIEGWERLFLAKAIEAIAEAPASLAEPVACATLSDILDRFPRGEVVEPVASSWSTTREDLDAGSPYPLWRQPGNEIHRLQWEHVAISLDLVSRAAHVADNEESHRHAGIARALMDEALHSCQFWWASRRPHWDVNMVDRGLNLQSGAVLNALRAVNLSAAPDAAKRGARARARAAAARDLQSRIRDLLARD
jgi:predicted glycosyl hydrolase (DUF1957 family)